MLDVTFKYKRQLSEILNESREEFYVLGEKHKAEYSALSEKWNKKIEPIMQQMLEEFSYYTDEEKTALSNNMEKFITSFIIKNFF